MLGKRHVDIAQMVDQSAIDFLRYALVKAAVASLHVENRDLPALGRNHSEAAISIAVEKHGIGPFLLENVVNAGNHRRDRLRWRIASRLQGEIRPADIELLEEDVIQLVVEVLAGMDQDLLHMAIELGDNARKLDELGPRANDGHYLELHGNDLSVGARPALKSHPPA